MTQTVIDLQEIRKAGQLLTVEEALNVLHTTEPMDETVFTLDGSSKVRFELPMYWNSEELRTQPGSVVTECTVQVDDADPIILTKEAVLKMTSSIGLTKDYVLRSPGPLITPQLNWWARNNGVKGAEAMRLLSKDGVAVAFIKSSLSTFPNIPVLERVLDRARDKYNTDEFYVDYKIAHSLERTALRVIIPAYRRTIQSARHTAGKEDEWSLGIQITNSLMGDPETRLNVSGYLFAWWCTNGAISTHATSGNYNRRVQGQDLTEVVEWVGSSVDAIFTDLEPELDSIEALTDLTLEGELNDTVADVFKQLKVPVPARKGVIDALVESDDFTAYGLMQAITQAANDPTITDHVLENTMRVGGILPHTITDRCQTCHRVNLG